MSEYTIGIDFGTDSVRALIADTANGNEISSAVFQYPRWKEGLYCNAANNCFRQHPKDYLEGLEYVVVEALKLAPHVVAEKVVGISVDTTGSTPVAVDERGTPLALTAGFEENPNAMFVLWKDHTAIKEAEEINQLAKKWELDYTKYVGGTYSPEWFWAKLLHIIREDAGVFRAAYSWVEHSDWIPALLCGNSNPKTLKRNRCAAGHKAMWHSSFDGLPSEAFLTALDPLLSGLRDRLYKESSTINQQAGTLSPQWAEKFGLSTHVVVGVGALDAHMGAVGAQIQANYVAKVMGTSTCDMLVTPSEKLDGKLINGICGQVDGSIVPGMTGLEAGQSAFGDIYAWFNQLLEFPLKKILSETELVDSETRQKLIEEVSGKLLARLSDEASHVPIAESGIIAVDWMNGRRTPYANEALKGVLSGLSLGSDAPRIFRALVEATAFGSKAITEHFISQGVCVDGIMALGGVAKKSPLVMQIMADVLDRPIKVVRSEQACALGAAMAAAVAAGVYNCISEAQEQMGGGFDKEYHPIPDNVKKYEELYLKYQKLGAFVEKQLNF